MRVKDIRSQDGRLLGFEISNSLIGRADVCALVSAIPGVRINHAPLMPGLSGDTFCEFELGQRRFVAYEPWGDSAEYWIGPLEPTTAPEVDLVRQAFVERRAPVWPSATRALATGVTGVGLFLLLFGLVIPYGHAVSLGAVLACSGCVGFAVLKKVVRSPWSLKSGRGAG